MDLREIIKGPLVTEKTDRAREQNNQYAFVVSKEASKLQVAAAVESLFKVKVLSVETSVVRGKIKRVGSSMGKRSNWKRAFVTIKAGEKIPLFEGGEF